MKSFTDTVFGLYVCQKKIYQPEIWHIRCPGMVLQHIVRAFEKKDFVKYLITISCFYSLGKKIICWKIRDSHFEGLLTLRLLLLSFCILLKISTFGDFSNIYQISTKNGMTLRHLSRFRFGFSLSSFRKKSKFLCNGVNLMYVYACDGGVENGSLPFGP